MLHVPDHVRLRYFLEVAERLSFHEAARSMNVAQPSITRAIQMLELDLGFQLLNRTTRRVVPTKAGAMLARDMRQAFEFMEKSIRHSRQIALGGAGDLVVGYSSQAANGIMADTVIKFRGQFPEATLSVVPGSSPNLVDLVESGQIDVSFVLSNAHRPTLAIEHLCRERLVALVPFHHKLAGRDSVSLHELRDEPFVMGNEKWRVFRSQINQICKRAGFVPNITSDADDIIVLLHLVQMGQGITLYGSQASESLPKALKAIPVEDHFAWFDIGVVYDPARNVELIGNFISAVQQSRQDAA